MGGHIDDVFESMKGHRKGKSSGGYVDGKWVEGLPEETTHRVNLQQLNQQDINFLQIGGERIQDTRKVYVNDGLMINLKDADEWTFEGVSGTYKAVSTDNRHWRNYCRFYAVRLDL